LGFLHGIDGAGLPLARLCGRVTYPITERLFKEFQYLKL
jgi:hypothetical protein